MPADLTTANRRPFYDPIHAFEADCPRDGRRMRFDPSEDAWLCPGCIEQFAASLRREAMTPSELRMYRRTRGGTVDPLPRSDYLAVVASGPCVYCNATATHVDHVRPLCDDGSDDLGNLVPACASCNLGKGGRPLSQWRADRVVHAIQRSPIVAAEFERLTTLPGRRCAATPAANGSGSLYNLAQLP